MRRDSLAINTPATVDTKKYPRYFVPYDVDLRVFDQEWDEEWEEVGADDPDVQLLSRSDESGIHLVLPKTTGEFEQPYPERSVAAATTPTLPSPALRTVKTKPAAAPRRGREWSLAALALVIATGGAMAGITGGRALVQRRLAEPAAVAAEKSAPVSAAKAVAPVATQVEAPRVSAPAVAAPTASAAAAGSAPRRPWWRP